MLSKSFHISESHDVKAVYIFLGESYLSPCCIINARHSIYNHWSTTRIKIHTENDTSNEAFGLPPQQIKNGVTKFVSTDNLDSFTSFIFVPPVQSSHFYEPGKGKIKK